MMLTTTKRMTKTSNGVRRVAFTLPGDPVPASRPRIRTFKARNGKTISSAYYAGKYKTYLDEAPTAIPESPITFEKAESLHVKVTFYCKQPLKPANPYPKADLDNYIKAILDAIGKNGTYWHDDVQVVSLRAYKTYTLIEPRTEVSIEALQ